MKPKLIELSEVLKQKPEIKERLERLECGCWVELQGIYLLGNLDSLRRIIDISDDRKIIFYRDFWKTSGIEIKDIEKIIGHEPAYHDVLEYLGEDYYLGNGFLCNIYMLDTACNPGLGTYISLSPGPLSDQSDETLTQIISLCKNVGKNV